MRHARVMCRTGAGPPGIDLRMEGGLIGRVPEHRWRSEVGRFYARAAAQA
jgi:hypothetical protein